jgi:hypothetical protein
MARSAMRALTAMLALAAGDGCARAAPCNGLSCAAACPRDSAVGAAGRCACAEGTVPLLGACVPPPVVEAFCGPAARVEGYEATAGCSFRACGAGLSLDVASGACIPRGMLPRQAFECRAPAVALVEDGRAACVSPEAACPRGTRPSGGDARSAKCERPPACPPGSLAEDSACRPVVTTGGRSGSRVDVGAWAALALGIHGGRGSSALCQPLAARPGLFGAGIGRRTGAADGADGGTGEGGRTVHVAVSIVLPDQDVSRLHAEVHARSTAGGPVSPAAEALVSASVGTLLEALRSLGGEASAASVELEVSCAVGEESM